MNIRNIAIMTASCAALLAANNGEATQRESGKQTAGYPLPEIKKDCDICHLPAGTHKPEELKKPVPQLCLDCHQDRTAPAEHGVGMEPSMPVKGLPLTDGKMTCVTCHDPHANANGTMLRMRSSKLCAVCHPK